MDLKFILEAVLFSAQKPMSPRELRELLQNTVAQSTEPAVQAQKKVREEEVLETLELLAQDYEDLQRSYRLACVAGSWQFVTLPEFSPWLMVMVGAKVRPPRLSSPALETLTILAYRQPITRAEIEQVRGVAVDGVMQTLVERGLVEQVGRAEVAGRPMTYGTTPLFLEYFGLRSLEDLPAADELRRIPTTAGVTEKKEGDVAPTPAVTAAEPVVVAESQPEPLSHSSEAEAAPAETESAAKEALEPNEAPADGAGEREENPRE